MSDHNNSPDFNGQDIFADIPLLSEDILSENEINPDFSDLDSQMDESSLTPEEIADRFLHLTDTTLSSTGSTGILAVKTANQWLEEASKRPIPEMLFSEFWHEGELCILFADTNLGKSILAVQIGNSVSKGKTISGFKLEAIKQPALYFDFELSDKQFENRYSQEYANHFMFDNEFFRVEIDTDATLPDGMSFEDYLALSIEASIQRTGAKVLIIDNITYLRTETENSREALPLMKQLKSLKAKYGLSLLVLAHTPKRDLSKPITRNDLAGSKALINFCDSAFTIGESHTEKHVRYLKQIKARNTEIRYDTQNVIVCQINKESNFVEFQFISFGTEMTHLKEASKKDRSELVQKVHALSKEGKTQREIGKELGVATGTVNKYLKFTVATQEL